MRYRTTVTVALTSFAIFLALVVAGGICVASGFADYAKNSGVVDSVKDVLDYVSDFDFEFSAVDTDNASAEYVRELNSDVEKVILSTGGYSVDVRNGSEFSVVFTGKVTAGKFSDLDQSGENVVSSADTAAYYDNSGIINAGFSKGVLEISVDSVKTISVIGFNSDRSIGHVTVTFPDSYNGSFELDDSFAEVSFAGTDFDELTLDSCMGEISLYDCSANMLTITRLAGEVEVDDGNIAGIRFENIAGEININTLCELTADSIISDIAGEINVELPAGSQLNVTRNDVLGDVRIDRAIEDGAGAAALEIIDVVGEVHVEIDG